MAGFRGGQADLHGLPVAHLADQDDLGRLTQGGPHADGEGAEIVTHFPLIEGGLFLLVDIFDRVLQGDDVHRPLLVDPVQEGGKRGGLTGTGGAGKENKAIQFAGHFVEGLGKLHPLDGRDLGLQFSQNRRKIAFLGEDIDPEPGLVGQRIGKIAGAVLHQIFEQPAVVADEVEGKGLGLERGQLGHRRGDLHRHQLTGRLQPARFCRR